MSVRKPISTYTLVNQVATTGATGQSGATVLRNFDFDALVFALTCSSMSATATLDVWVQSSLDGGTTWYDMLRFPRVTASGANPQFAIASLAGQLAMIGTIGASTLSSTAGGTGVPLLSNVINVFWNLGGTTPSASFALAAYQHQQSQAQ